MKVQFWCEKELLVENNLSLLPRVGDNIYLYTHIPYTRHKYQVMLADWSYSPMPDTFDDDAWTIQVHLTRL